MAQRLVETLVSVFLGILLSLPMMKCIRLFFPLRFSVYLASLGLYHWAEYLYVALFHFEKLNFDSFLLNQSIHYMGAMLISFLEGILTQLIFPHELDIYEHLSNHTLIRSTLMATGLVMMAAGHYFRISAEMTAGRNFNHQI